MNTVHLFASRQAQSLASGSPCQRFLLAWHRIFAALSKRGAHALGVLLLALPLALGAEVGGGEAKQFLESWLARQAQIESWSADVVQTRKLTSLVRPLETRGQVWVRYPNQFRWQLGNPPRTIAVRTDDKLEIVYPPLRRIERYALSENIDPSWRAVLALLEVGFPSKPSEFYRRYEVVDARQTGASWTFELRPVAEQARRLVERIRLKIANQDATIRATELVFADGSNMRTEFVNHQINPDLDEALFTVEPGEKFEIIEATKAGD